MSVVIFTPWYVSIQLGDLTGYAIVAVIGSNRGGGFPGRQVAGKHALLLDDRNRQRDPSLEYRLDWHPRVGHDDDAIVRGIAVVLPRQQIPSLTGVGYVLNKLWRAHRGDLTIALAGTS